MMMVIIMMKKGTSSGLIVASVSSHSFSTNPIKPIWIIQFVLHLYNTCSVQYSSSTSTSTSTSNQTNLDHLICSIHTHTHIQFTIYYQHQHKWNLHFLGIIDHDHRYHGGIFSPTLALSTFVSISGFDITKFNAFIALVNHNLAFAFLANVGDNDAVI